MQACAREETDEIAVGIHWAGIALSRVSGMTVAEYFK